MPSPEISGFGSLDTTIQTAITVGVGISTAIGAGWIYLRRLTKTEPKDEGKTDFVLTAAQFMDLGPIRDQNKILADTLVETRESRRLLGHIVEYLNDLKNERTIQQEVERRLHEVLTEKAREAVEQHRSPGSRNRKD